MKKLLSGLLLGGLLLSFLSTSFGGEARGVRNMNPGNITKTAIEWQGEVPCNDNKFECFDSASSGIRALLTNLRTYNTRHQVDTLSGIVARWESGGTIPNASYLRFMEACTVLEGTTRIDTRDRVIRTANCLIEFENGGNPYGNLVAEVYDATYGSGNLTWVNGPGRTDETVGDEAPAEAPGVGVDAKGSGVTPEGYSGCAECHGQGVPIHEANDSVNSYVRSLCATALGDDYRPNDSCVVRVDRDKAGFLVLYQRQGDSSVASDSRWISSDSLTYPRSDEYHGAVLRGERSLFPILIMLALWIYAIIVTVAWLDAKGVGRE